MKLAVCLLLVVVLCLFSGVWARKALKVQELEEKRKTSFFEDVEKQSKSKITNSGAPNLDMCPLCVNFMENTIGILVNIIFNIGVLDSCNSLCGLLPDQLEQVACDLICSYVGIDAFVAALTFEDPDPIFVCEELSLCPVIAGGLANITETFVSPKSGGAGTQFTFGINYDVIKELSTGMITNLVFPLDNSSMPFGDEEFFEPQQPGKYSISWQLDTTPSEQEAFNPGWYIVQFAVCAGDCTTKHPYGGIYAQSETKFYITNSSVTHAVKF